MFKLIGDFPDYAIYDDGRVWSNKSKKFLLPYKMPTGYLRVTLRKEGRPHYKYVHRLVADAFVDNPNNYKEINHKDENKSNNDFTNLEWCTVAYNTRYSYTHLGRKGNHTTDIKCKLKVDNEVVGEFHSIKEAAEYANIHYKASKSSLIKYYKLGNISIEKCND